MLSAQGMTGRTPGEPAWVESKPACQMGCSHCPVPLREGEEQICMLLRGREVKTKIKENHRLLLERRALMRQEQPGRGPGLRCGFPEALLVGPGNKQRAGRTRGGLPFVASLTFLTQFVPLPSGCWDQVPGESPGSTCLSLWWARRGARSGFRLMSVSRWRVTDQAVLMVPVAFVCPTGRGGGRLTALLWGERTREGRLHGPGHHPTLTPIQVTPPKAHRYCNATLCYISIFIV